MNGKKLVMALVVILFVVAIGYLYYFKSKEPDVVVDLPEVQKEEPKPEAPAEKPPEPAKEEEPPYTGREEILALREKYGNDEIIGILKVEGTEIDYPLLHHEDNDFYLSHGPDKEPNSEGSIFLDFENMPQMTDLNSIIYGHNQNNGAMFHNIRFYEDEEFYKEHKFISLKTMDEETVWEIFAYYRTTVDFPYNQVIFPDRETFDKLVAGMLEKAAYKTGVEVTKDDIILSLSTCTPDDSESERIVVSAKKLSGKVLKN